MSKDRGLDFPSIGFIGLGALGLALAEKIDEKAGLTAVWNRSPGRYKSLSSDTISKTATIEDLCTQCRWVFCCVSDDKALSEVVHAVTSATTKPTVFISLSSCTPGTVTEIEQALIENGIEFLNVPVLGKPEIVRAGMAGYLFSGQGQTREDVLGLFDKLGGTVHDLGPDTPTSAAIKLSMNFLIASMITSFSEAFAQLGSADIDPSQLLRVVENSPLGSPIAKMFGQAILDQAFTPAQFDLTLACKDIRYFGTLTDDALGLFLYSAILRHMDLTFAMCREPTDWSGLAGHLFRKHQG